MRYFERVTSSLAWDDCKTLGFVIFWILGSAVAFILFVAAVAAVFGAIVGAALGVVVWVFMTVLDLLRLMAYAL